MTVVQEYYLTGLHLAIYVRLCILHSIEFFGPEAKTFSSLLTSMIFIGSTYEIGLRGTSRTSLQIISL